MIRVGPAKQRPQSVADGFICVDVETAAVSMRVGNGYAFDASCFMSPEGSMGALS